MFPPLTYEPSEYKTLAMELDKRGFQIMTHVLRADTAHMVLDTYEAAENKMANRDAGCAGTRRPLSTETTCRVLPSFRWPPACNPLSVVVKVPRL